MTTAFLILIPGYFFYHWLSQLGIIPMFMGGYSNESAVIAIAIAMVHILLALHKHGLQNWKVNKTEVMFGIFVSYFCTVVTIHWMLKTAPDVTLSHTASAVQLLAMFAVFRFTNLNSSKLQKALKISIASISALVYHNAAANGFGQLYIASISDNSATYQGLSRMLMLTVIVVTTFSKYASVRLIHYLNAATIIFLLGARSEFAALIVFAVVFEIMSFKTQGVRRFFNLIPIGAILIATIALLSSMKEIIPNNRILALFEFEADGSVIERTSTNLFAIQTIEAHPFLGDYGSYVTLGSAGHYAHNLLSAWVDLGLFGFLLLVMILVTNLVDLLEVKIKRILENTQAFSLKLLGIGLLAQSILLVTVAKNFTDVSIAIAVGVIGALNRRTQHERARRTATSVFNQSERTLRQAKPEDCLCIIQLHNRNTSLN